jgi:hypothetical protein
VKVVDVAAAVKVVDVSSIPGITKKWDMQDI